MRKLSLIILMVLFAGISLAQQSPHGDKLAFSCTDCHTTEGWKFSASTAKFSHDLTTFKLEGQHFYTDCAACHKTLVFSEAKTNCIDCHTDMHNSTVGPNCAECHTPKSWLVNNITEIHQNSRFPLLGAHNTADCSACHTSASKLEFQPLGIECYDCHRADYQAATNPNHVQSGISTNCFECHKIDAFEWSASGINHDFFPLTKGHEIENCADCHTSGISLPISPNCYDCHQKDYNSAVNPSHQNSGFSTNCTECHTTDPDWKPAEFKQHDTQYFPVYSGSHKGEWNSCADCHTQPENYNKFSCIDCHEHNKTDMDKEHREENGYSYNSNACFACHPNGNKEGAFNHNSTAFPLTGSHLATECSACHTSGYAGTSPLCNSCHNKNYNQSVNPNHSSLAISTNCEECHSTGPGWNPAKFPIHNDYYALNGAHATVSNNCFLCHEGNYINTKNTCFECHSAKYNSTTNPAHAVAQFPTDCATCHTEIDWKPSTFDHDNQYFPIYSGKHREEWNSCLDCHTAPSNYSVFSCLNCHEHNKAEMDDKHSEVSGYAYNSINCLACHPRGTHE